MIKKRKSFFLLLLTLMALSILGLLTSPAVRAQNGALMPPYNVLWPLWSSVLSPVDPLTGLKTPLVPELTRNTILPVQPAIAWDPTTSIWALYNTPPLFGSGLLFFDRLYGLNSWPPPYLYDSVAGIPNPITFTVTWSLLPATGATGGGQAFFIPLANAIYALTYGLTGPEYLNLLTTAQIWGFPAI